MALSSFQPPLRAPAVSCKHGHSLLSPGGGGHDDSWNARWILLPPSVPIIQGSKDIQLALTSSFSHGSFGACTHKARTQPSGITTDAPDRTTQAAVTRNQTPVNLLKAICYKRTDKGFSQASYESLRLSKHAHSRGHTERTASRSGLVPCCCCSPPVCTLGAFFCFW